MKNLYKKGFYCTIFILSTNLVVPLELEALMTIVEVGTPDTFDIQNLIKDFSMVQDIHIEPSIIDEMTLSFKGLSEFEIYQILNLAYQSNGEITADDKALILREKEQFVKKSGMLEIINFQEDINDIVG